MVQEITGVVTKVSSTELKRVRATGEEEPFKKIKLRDITGDTDVCLWRGTVAEDIQRGEVVKLQNFCVTDTFNAVGATVPALTNKDSSSKLQRLPPDENYIGLLQEENDKEDDGFSGLPQGKIIGISAIKTYRSCLNDRCYRKQLKEYKCPTCHVTYSLQD